MKLKTKFQDENFDLGEVVEADIYHGGSERIKVVAEPTKGGIITFYFGSLEELNDLFEDAPEEPKEYWYLDCYGMVLRALYTGNEWDERRKLIGNYFETKEEAEKAREKLKAWKRLKDNGLRITGWKFTPDMKHTKGNFVTIKAEIPYIVENQADLDLLFGGEE